MPLQPAMGSVEQQQSQSLGGKLFLYETVPTRRNLLRESLWAGICPTHSPPSSEYFSVEQFGKAPLGRVRALHVKTWLQNVSEAVLS